MRCASRGNREAFFAAGHDLDRLREMTRIPVRYRVNNLQLQLGEPEAKLRQKAAAKLGVAAEAVLSIAVMRRSLDARKKGHARWLVSIDATLDGPLRSPPPDVTPAPEPEPPPPLARAPRTPPVIVGAGPAGLFCAWALLERGIRSVIVDRGTTVGPRRRDVAELMRSGHLDPESNMYFGEGGAGAFTDGKLGTRIHHPAVQSVVALFARFGQVPGLTQDAKPHVGSDVLPRAVAAMRAELERGGCEFHWGARVTDLLVERERVRGVSLADGRQLHAARVILAPGNSA